MTAASYTDFRSRIGKAWDEPISVALYRWWTPRLSWWLVQQKVTANQVTVFGALAGIAGGILAATTIPVFLIIGAVLLQAYVVADHVDGEVARGHGVKGWHGGWLDTVANHLTTQPLIIGAFGVAAWVLGAPWWALALAGLGVWGVLVSMGASLSRTMLEPDAPVSYRRRAKFDVPSYLIYRSVQFVEVAALLPIVVGVAVVIDSFWPPLTFAIYYGTVYPVLTGLHVMSVMREAPT